MIYSMLGMLTSICGPNALPEHLRPDYDLPPERVYWDYSRWIIERTGDLNLLCHTGQSLDGVPNSVPDFRHTCGFTKKTDSVRSGKFTPRVSADGLLLTVEVTQLGRCITVCPGIAASDIPNPFREQDFDSLMADRQAHGRWLQRRCSLVEDVICKHAVEVSNVGKNLKKARLDVLRPDGMIPSNPDAQALLMDVYQTICSSYPI